jgi:UDP-glucose 6-dehydrogenase
MESVLVIGLGEVGMSLYEIIKESKRYNVFGKDPKVQLDEELPSKVDIIHICFPCTKTTFFVNAVVDYAKSFEPRLLIINSTVPPKTTNLIAERCDCLVVHSPIFGTHTSREHFKSEVRRFAKIVGGVTADARDAAVQHFFNVGLKTRTVRSPLESETLKIMSTSFYGVMIALSQEFHRASKVIGADYNEIIELICYLHECSLARPPSYPDVIGGHCVIPNIDLLLSVYDSDFLKAVKESNIKRKEEIKNPEIAKEIAEIKEIVSAFWKNLLERFKP